MKKRKRKPIVPVWATLQDCLFKTKENTPLTKFELNFMIERYGDNWRQEIKRLIGE